MNITEREFTQLVHEQKSTIYTVCYMFARDKDEAADLFQDVLINLWKGIGKFRNDSEISTWVYRVSLNTCISADRKKRKMPTTRLDMNIDLFDDDDTDSRQIQVLRQRIQRLQPLDRAIVLLWLESLSYQEIADIVGLTPKNISVRLTRIRLQLKQMKD
ncbi:RNA polymerase sigma factor [Prevotellamassilia timonensis]|uniref:RNA polymerase sigma factor n=1 Tax=Prevotellamassilia timonensis TaxID=1852370 RepID=UPI001E12B550|nr:sigma-70 family RNA polymerase sigma factor [Prevotellamassilia timonensis]MBS7396001.1 sigma-70 family RNA polymerase sigma factor [Prevotellamassilia sp.]MCI6069956.1 sigma-70 family RNA polymerase sigma factor [Bacteroidales bacterium]MDD7028715.1 sigma-70 family RNA polymerase sigma factor [Prevotellaceae bacterium]MDY4620801.1 sigma-70 family RNA polymerase sigma factor [Alloprevotella sp.]MDY5209145.1 sigma-70 family RNA polymerase sigma factor [Prevotella sp.]